MNICFLDNNPISYDQSDLQTNKIRGAEKALINLALEFNRLGHKITILNNIEFKKEHQNIRWLNINNRVDTLNFDVAITNNDINNFDRIKCYKKIAISHSIQSVEKFIRKKQLFAYLKHKPKVCFLSEYHLKKRSKLLYLFGNINLRYAVDDIFLNTNLNDNVDKNLAIFTSRQDRNLDLLLKIWTNYIYPQNNGLKLLVTDNNLNYKNANIFKRKLSSQHNLIDDLLKARIFLIPGHKAELFCLAAEEAKELCVPIITLGKGCLSERVEDGKTGFIARDEKEFAKYTLELFANDSLWKEMRNNLINIRGKKNWLKVAENLIKQI